MWNFLIEVGTYCTCPKIVGHIQYAPTVYCSNIIQNIKLSSFHNTFANFDIYRFSQGFYSFTTSIILLFIFLSFSFFFSGSETSIFSINPITLKRLRDKYGKIASPLQFLLNKPEDTITTILIGNMFVNIAFTLTAATMIYKIIGKSPIIIFSVNSILITFVILLFGEITPKSIAIINAEHLATFVAYPVCLFYYLFSPVRLVLSVVTKLLTFLFKKDIYQDVYTTRDIRALISLSELEGVLVKEEREMIEGVFDLGERAAEDAMTHRTELECYDMNTPDEKMREIARTCKHTRLPIYDGKIDTIVGILHIREVLLNPDEPFKKFLKEPYFIPPSKKLVDLLKEFQESSNQIAIVVDEFGGTDGLVTITDILEEIVGDIRDEDDMEEEEEIKKLAYHKYLVLGRIEIDKLNEALSLNLPENDYRTLAGLLIHQLGEIPREKEEVFIGNCKFTILRVSKRIISRVLIDIEEEEVIETGGE